MRLPLLLTLLTVVPGCAGGQTPRDASGDVRPDVEARAAETAATLQDSAGTQLVDVTLLDPTLILDIRYATPRNFTGRTLYPVARCLLRPDVAERLVRVHERLKQEGLRLV